MLTKDDLQSSVSETVVNVFNGVGSATDSAMGTAAAIAAVENIVLNSPLYRKLTEKIEQLNIPLEAIKASGTESDARITAETQTRADADFALAAAVNTIWAAVGDANAVIQDGNLAAATQSTATAQKWSQVQSAVIDPSTGQNKVAAIRQDFNTYASNVDGKLNAAYTLRVDAGGKIAGFGVMATSGAGSAQGATSQFIINADRLSLANASTNTVPFSVDSSGNAIFTGSLQTGTAGMYGATMYGSGALFNRNGTFALGNSSKSLTFDGTNFQFNGDVIVTGAIKNNAITRADSASAGSTSITAYPSTVLASVVQNTYWSALPFSPPPTISVSDLVTSPTMSTIVQLTITFDRDGSGTDYGNIGIKRVHDGSFIPYFPTVAVASRYQTFTLTFIDKQIPSGYSVLSYSPELYALTTKLLIVAYQMTVTILQK